MNSGDPGMGEVEEKAEDATARSVAVSEIESLTCEVKAWWRWRQWCCWSVGDFEVGGVVICRPDWVGTGAPVGSICIPNLLKVLQ